MSSKRCVKIFISCATEVEDCLLRFHTHMNSSSACCVRQSNKLSLSQFHGEVRSNYWDFFSGCRDINITHLSSKCKDRWTQISLQHSLAALHHKQTSLVIQFFVFFYCYTGLYCAWQCEHASAHVIFKTSRFLEHMDTNRWAQSDTRHLGNKHLVGAALALFLDPPLGLGCLMRHSSSIKKTKSNNNSNKTCVWSLQSRAGSVLTGQIPMLLCRIRYIVITMNNPVC